MKIGYAVVVESVISLTVSHWMFRFFFFFQAEDGIRDYKVTGVQTCALPISMSPCSPTVTQASTSPANHQSISFLSQDQESRAMASPVFTQAHHATGAQ